MGKRSTFDRAPRDFYPTPIEAVLPLLPHLAPGTLADIMRGIIVDSFQEEESK